MTGSEKTHVRLATGTSQLMSPAQPCFSAFPCCAAHSSSAARTALTWPLHPAHWPRSSPHSLLPFSLSVAAAQAQYLYAVILWSSVMTTLHFSDAAKSPQSQHAPHVRIPSTSPRSCYFLLSVGWTALDFPISVRLPPLLHQKCVRLLGENRLCARP